MNKDNAYRGWVYVITSPAFAKLVKIGFTLKDPRIRASELKSTGNPYEYEVEYEIFCSNPKQVEYTAHKKLANFNENKEWFKCTKLTAISAIRASAGDHIYYETSNWNLYRELGYDVFWRRYESDDDKLQAVIDRLNNRHKDDDGRKIKSEENIRDKR